MRELEGVVTQQNHTLHEIRHLMSRMRERERTGESRGAQARLAPDNRPRKKLLLVRHGESTHNVSPVAEHGDSGGDAALYDAPLTKKGESQVAKLAGHKALAAAELLVSSPL